MTDAVTRIRMVRCVFCKQVGLRHTWSPETCASNLRLARVKSLPTRSYVPSRERGAMAATITVPERLADDVVLIRRDLHIHPELGFYEYRTAGIVAERLRALGFDVHEAIGKTGV